MLISRKQASFQNNQVMESMQGFKAEQMFANLLIGWPKF
jgi:hypothetical protein